MIGKKLTPFKFWCQKVLPTVYDDSLSYYEYLGKLNEYLNEVIEQINTLTEAEEDFQEDLSAQWTAYKNGLNTEWLEYKTELTAEWNTYRTQLTEAWTTTKNYIDNYFDNLDVQEEINNKLDVMATDGTLSNLIEGVISDDIPSVVTAWLNENVDPVGSAVTVDKTLSISGSAADAEVTGYNVNKNSARIVALESKFNVDRNYVNPTFSTGFVKRDGTVDSNTSFEYTSISVTDLTKDIYVNGVTWYGTVQPYVYVQTDGTIVHPDLPAVTSITYVSYMKFSPVQTGTLYINRYANDARVNPYYPVVGYLTNTDIPLINQFFYGKIKNIASHGYLKTDGTITYEETLSYVSEKIACAENEVFHYSGTYGLSASACVYFDDSGAVVSYEGKSSISQAEADFTVPANATSVQFSSYQNVFEVYKKSELFENYLSMSGYSSVLFGKKWCAFGDSFTHGDFTGYVDGEGHTGTASDAYDPVRGMYKTWAWNIADRNHMNLINLAENGATTKYLTTNNLYQSVPSDCEYVTFMLGLNDSVFDGDITSTDPTTWYGAWNVTFAWLRANRPHARLGIIIPPSWLGNSVRGIIEDVAEYNGVPVLNLYSNKEAPALLGTLDGTKVAKSGMNSAISVNVTTNNVVTSTNQHPNLECFKQMSDIIENFMKNL